MPTKRNKRRSTGGGWATGPASVTPGYLVNQPYDGVGKDCAGVPVRSGYLSDMSLRGGLPGLRGGKRRVKRSLKRSLKRRGGYTAQHPLTVSNSLTDKPSTFPDTTGKGGVYMSMPGVPIKGGRYGNTFASMQPLSPNGVGSSSFAPVTHLPCERGTTNSLNSNPGNIQSLTTLKGGAQLSSANFPTVAVGAADSMRYYAPTAGYGHQFQEFPAPSAVGGLMLNTPYDARAFNQGCIKTGGAALSGAALVPLQMGQVGSRADFDGSQKGLPVKFGGRRKSRAMKRRSGLFRKKSAKNTF